MSIFLKFKNATIAYSYLLCVTFSTYAAQAWVHNSSTGSSDIKISGCIFNILNYGATADNASDNDASKIQDAINAARRSGGGTVFIPAGWYHIDTSLYIGTGISSRGDSIGDNVKIIGEGVHKSVLVARSSNDIIVFRGGADETNLSTNNILSDFSIHKTNDNGITCQNGGTAIAINRASGVIIRNIKIWNYHNSAMQAPRYNAGIAIRNLCDEVRIYNSFFKCADTAIVMDGSTNSTTICDNIFWDSKIHIYVHGGSGSRIINNTMGNATVTGIKIYTASSDIQWRNLSLLISANEMEGNGAEYNSSTNTHSNFQHNEIWIVNENPGRARGLTISNNYFNLHGMKDIFNYALYTPYDVYNATQDQIREITFHNNTYSDYDANPRSEGLSIGKVPNAEINLSKPLTVKGNVTVDGKIGVGTENPQAKIDVVDNTTHTQAIFGQGNTYTNSNSQIIIGCPNNAQSLIAGYNHTGQYVHLRRFGDLMGSQSLNISSEGRVGIGVANPSTNSKLEVNGNIKVPSSNKFLIGSIEIKSGSGAPSGSDGAPVGSIYFRTDGSTNTTLYVKTGSNTWTAK